jgi:hypothetical protein
MRDILTFVSIFAPAVACAVVVGGFLITVCAASNKAIMLATTVAMP